MSSETQIQNITSEFLSMIKLLDENGKKLNYLMTLPIGMRVDSTYRFPVGFAVVSSALKASGRNVFTFNPNYKADPFKLLERIIIENEIDVILTGGFSLEFWNIKEIVDAAKVIKPDIITVVGGGLITADPITSMEALENADYGIIGEGEITVNALAHALENDYDPATLGGIICYRKGSWSINKNWPSVSNLDILPFPDYEGFEYSQMMKDARLSISIANRYEAVKSEKTGYINISRSCPFKCTYCFHSCGDKYRKMSIDHAFKLLDWLISLHPLEVLVFQDELTFSDREYTLEFCRRLKQYNLRWKCFARVDLTTEDMLLAIMESGCGAVSMGIESGDNSILKSMGRNYTIERTEQLRNYAEKIGLTIYGGLIIGDQEETMETFWNSINWRESQQGMNIGRNTVSIDMIHAYPGTHIYKVACEKGIIPDPVQFLKDGCPLINVSKMTDDEYNTLPTLLRILKIWNQLVYTRIKVNADYTIDITGQCPHCSKKHDFRHVELLFDLTPRSCVFCGNMITVTAIEYCDLEKLNRNIESLISKDNKVAVWAINLNNFYWLLKRISIIKREHIRLINREKIVGDKHQNLYGTSIIESSEGERLYSPDIIYPNTIVRIINNKEKYVPPNPSIENVLKTLEGLEIFTPDIISKEGIDTIIVPNNPQVLKRIKEQCVAEFPSVKRIVHITELL